MPRRKNHGLGGSMISVIVLSCFTAFIICVGLAWLLLLKSSSCVRHPEQIPHALILSPMKPSGITF